MSTALILVLFASTCSTVGPHLLLREAYRETRAVPKNVRPLHTC
jgi:hypothetical protein